MCATGTILITRVSFFDRFCDLHRRNLPIKLTLAEMGDGPDAKYLRQQSELCSRLADGLSLNNPSRFELMRMAEDCRKRAIELETKTAQQRRQSQSNPPENRARQSRS